jgi:hypothetical protein
MFWETLRDNMPYKIPRPRQRRKHFLRLLAEGISPTFAAKKAGISRAHLYRWRATDMDFAKDWDEAVADGVDGLEDEAVRRAVKGVTRLVYKNGAVVGEVTEYSDRLLALLLQRRRPEVLARK